MKKIILFLILVIFLSGCAQEVEEGIVPAPSSEVQVYKGVWVPALLSDNPKKLDSDMKKLKELGMNTVFFQGSPPQIEHCLEGLDPDSKVVKKMKKIIPIQKKVLISNIQAAHRNGLRVALTMAKCSGGMGLEDWIDLEVWNSKIIEYAELAEEYDVEFFAPMNEPEVLFGPSASATWGQEILPKIRKVYNGKVVWKGGAFGDMETIEQPDVTNFSGYDYIGFTVGVGSGNTLENLLRNMDYILDRILYFAERDNCKGVMITEFYGQLPYRWKQDDWSQEKEARAHEIVLEKASEYDKIIGFFALDFLEISFLGEDIPGLPGPEESAKTEELIRKWFTEELE